MTWIRVIGPEEADGDLARRFRRSAGGGQVDRIMQVHSLRSHMLDGHMALYRSVLHHDRNTLPQAFAEAIGVLVSRINRCRYCVDHHEAGMRRALGGAEQADAWLTALDAGPREEVFDTRQRAALAWVEKITTEPHACAEEDVDRLRRAGWSDGEILEISQVAGYFAYANRTVLALGVRSDGEKLGEHPQR